MRIGILGGTFDPIHNGHLAAARQLLEVVPLQEVWLVPNAHPAHRSSPPVASAKDRMRMVELAVAGQPRLRPSRLELERGGISFTIDTSRELRAKFPTRPFAILLGSDAALQIRSWHEVEALLREANFVIFNRPETSLAPETFERLGFPPARTRLVHVDTPAIAAHQIRDRLARGVAIDDLVPSSVAEYILARGLYRS